MATRKVNKDSRRWKRVVDVVECSPEASTPTALPASYPRHPTRGWMFSELERCGILVRGRPLSDEELAAMLRARGYNVEGTAEPRPKLEAVVSLATGETEQDR
jgi:hypothetical protein